jgi:hypothetical protein
VRKHYSLHLFNSIFRIGSDRLSVQRDEAHMVSHVVRADGTTVTLTVPLRAPDGEHRNYQLATLRVGRIVFAHWFKEPPVLDAAFGLQPSTESLQGDVRLHGLAAPPLNGSLPLWPTLRRVELTIVNAEPPAIVIWDPLSRHHWNGWRQTVPQFWPGGRTVVARHIAGPTVWRTHDYHAVLPANDAPLTRSAPPEGVLPGAALEVFWPPEGASLEFSEAKFGEAQVMRFRVDRLTPRARELLARSVERRPGVEMNSLSEAEWSELEALIEEGVPTPMEWAFERNAADEDVLRVHRRAFNEPWLYLFGVKYDYDRRFLVHPVVLTPARWTGELPE